MRNVCQSSHPDCQAPRGRLASVTGGYRQSGRYFRLSQGCETGRWTGRMTAQDSTERQAQVDDLVARMTLEEKLSQLVGLWVGADATGAGVAPHQSEMTDDGLGWTDVIARRARPADPPVRLRARSTPPRAHARWPPRRPRSSPRTGGASPPSCTRSASPGSPPGAPPPTRCRCPGARASTPSWSRRWPPRIGASMRAAGVHQGLAPVLDVTRDYRWGRTEETIGEDPYLVGTVGTAYVRGLQGAGRRRHAEALRRLLGQPRRTQPRPRSRSARASSPT